ncbi:MAG: hypothetical protein GYA24_20035 [Candidatus Lokiarchaeota archaeon]|nr:hypothetical protein [Candidatus Lokiarchaeota archaeon]
MFHDNRFIKSTFPADVYMGGIPACQISSLADPANYQVAGTLNIPMGSIITDARYHTLGI